MSTALPLCLYVPSGASKFSVRRQDATIAAAARFLYNRTFAMFYLTAPWRADA